MKSETRRTGYRTRIKKRTTYKILKKGGAAGKAPLEIRPEIFARYDIRRYYTHSLILKNFFLPKIFEACKERAILVFFINRGHNGFILQFICNTENAIKILFNDFNPLDNIDLWKRKIKASLEKEYTNINLFNESPYIIKSDGYFIFDRVNFICTGKKPYDKTYTPDEAITDETYKVLPYKAKEGVAKIVEPFGGIILEYVNHSLTDIESHLHQLHGTPEADIRFITFRVFNLINLFYQYIKGISDINSAGYIHTDIKIENLMFNNKGNKYTAKIVDLANIKPISTAWEFETNSDGGRYDQYHTGALMKLKSLQAKLGHRPTTVGENRRFKPVPSAKQIEESEAMKKEILVRYDLYSLCVTFYYILETIQEKETEQTNLFDFENTEKLASKPIRPKDHRKFTSSRVAFTNFKTKITEIKENPYKDLNAILTIPDNTTLKNFILEECLRQIDEDFENPK